MGARPSRAYVNFAAGEFGQDMDGRIDLDAYKTACHELENMIAVPSGKAFRRPGTWYGGTVKDSDNAVRFIPFRYTTTQSFVLEFGDYYFRVWTDTGSGPVQVLDGGGSVIEVTTPYPVADIFGISYAQSADVLELAHADYPQQRIVRVSATEWQMYATSFYPPAISVPNSVQSGSGIMTAITGTGVTFTNSSSVFVAGDIGRRITFKQGIAYIVGYTSGTVVTIDIVSDFPAECLALFTGWKLLDSPIGEITISNTSVKGSKVQITSSGLTKTDLIPDATSWLEWSTTLSIYLLLNTSAAYSLTKPDEMYERGSGMFEVSGTTNMQGKEWGWFSTGVYNTIFLKLESSGDPNGKYPFTDWLQRGDGDLDTAIALFRAADVGKYIRANNGIFKIVAYIDAQAVDCIVIKPPDNIDPTEAWTLEAESWSSTLGYPRAVTFHQDRLFYGGSASFPTTAWGSVTGDYGNFSPGANDSDSVTIPILAREPDPILHLVSGDTLIALTSNAEWQIGERGTALTPATLFARQGTNIGSSIVNPLIVNDSTVFINRSTRSMFQISYQFATDGYEPAELSIRNNSVFGSGVKDMAFQVNPYPIIWTVTNDGDLAACTISTSNNVFAWHRHTTQGTFETIAVIPNLLHDQIWVSVLRDIGGVTVRTVEVFDTIFNVDGDATDATGSAFADCCPQPYDGVSTSTITGLTYLNNDTVAITAQGGAHPNKIVRLGSITLDYAVTKATVGLPYTPRLTTMRMVLDGQSQTLAKRITKITARVHKSLTFNMGTDDANSMLSEAEMRTTPDATGTPPPLRSGDYSVESISGSEDAARVVITQSYALPLSVLAIFAEVDPS